MNLKTSFRNATVLLGGSLLLVSAQAAITSNALSNNALSNNALTNNALSNNALTPNAVASSAAAAEAPAQAAPLGAYTPSRHWDLTTVRLQKAAAAR